MRSKWEILFFENVLTFNFYGDIMGLINGNFGGYSYE
jgi:hypothetical protein